jgi:hypothetical protein
MALLDVGAVLAGYLILTAAILSLGRAGLAALNLDPESDLEFNALAWIAGAALFSHLAFFLALAGWLKLGLPILILALLAGWLVRRPRFRLPRLARPQSIGAAIPILFLGIWFIASMAPSQDSDGYRYHLGFPRLYLNAGGMFPIREDFYSAFPQGMEMLFLAGLRVGDFTTANLLHWNFLAALCALLFSRGIPGVCAAAVISASPVVGVTAAGASVELGLAAAIWVVFHGWSQYEESGGRSWLILAALAAGFSCSIKYTGLIAAILLAALLATAPQAVTVRHWLIATLLPALWVSPWMIRNWAYFDNPFYPFLNAFFPNPYLLPSSELAWIEAIRRYNGASFDLSMPWEAAMRGVKTMGFAGPFFLLTPVLLIGLFNRPLRRLILAGVVVGFPWFTGVPILRFAIPMLPFLALAIAASLLLLRPNRLAARLLLLATCVHAAMNFPPFIGLWNKQTHNFALRNIPWRQALRLESPDQYWTRTLPTYGALKFAESNLPASARIIAFDEQYQFFTTRLMASPYASESSASAVAMLLRAADPGLWPGRNCSLSFPAVRTARLRLRQHRDEPERRWTLYELQLQPQSPARPTAIPNPWEANLALDGNLVTAWSSKAPMRAGMVFQLDLPEEQSISTAQWRTSVYEGGDVSVEWSADGSNWNAIDAVPVCADAPPVSDFRLRTTSQLRRLGWTHLLCIRPMPWLEPDRDWQMQVVYSKGGEQLIALRPDHEQKHNK